MIYKSSAWLLLILLFCSSCNEEISPIVVDDVPSDAKVISEGVASWRTYQFGFDKLIENQEQWSEEVDEMRQILNNPTIIPEAYESIDFDTYKVLILFADIRGSNDYFVSFDSIQVIGPDISVSFHHFAPLNDLRFTPVHQSYSIVLIPNRSGELKINHEMDEPHIYPNTVFKTSVDQSQNLVKEFFVIENDKDWQELIDRLGSYWESLNPQFRHAIDFDSTIIIGAIDNRSSGDRTIDVTDVIEGTDSVEVRIKRLWGTASQNVSQFMHFVQIPRIEKSIYFTVQDL